MKFSCRSFVFVAVILASNAFSQNPRSIDDYLRNEYAFSVLVVGTGHDIRTYPENYFLIDIDPVANPDFQTDFANNVLPEVLIEEFDVVLLEYLPHKCLLGPKMAQNLYEVLRPGGMIIGNMPITLVGINDLDIKLVSELTEYIKDIDSPTWWDSEVEPHGYRCDFEKVPEYPFLSFVSTEEGEEKVNKKVITALSDWANSVDFDSVSLFTHDDVSEFWKAAPDPDGYFCIIK